MHLYKRIHHVAYRDKDFDASIAFFEKASKMPIKDQQYHLTSNEEILFFEVGGTLMEMLRPADKESKLNKSLEKQGEGFDHIAFEVENIEEALATLKENGVKLIDEKPRKGFKWKVADLDPGSTLGVATQIVEIYK